ncbi:hypothetical protein CCAX7_008920 [Capsulimonas corticalis]|uniref:Uncharacterized protein n=1 Tax=Capsulimonas corticalis TaxID=2219043 RepID=A0A402CU51_9BACT|nr:hypothetical protein [Capsulimonas corticalis]BDI28841.1 hypothetical protein CCAX7_008920 [Capsulimonas corticalis]
MTSISTTISSLAATNPIVGNAVAYASKQSQILSTLSGSSASASLQNLLASANSQSLSGVTVLPTLTSSTAAASDTASAAASATAASTSTSDFSGNSALLTADSQSLVSSQLLSGLTGVGGTFSGTA